tara:strand:+ start:18414 stop:19616 length:1203 start_codon:yes stop_codon:yes gene_type:complete
MNNIVLQKLITAHNLIPSGGILTKKSGKEFHESWKVQQYMMGFQFKDLPTSVQTAYPDQSKIYGMNSPIMFESLGEHGMYHTHGGVGHFEQGLDLRNVNKFNDNAVKETLRENAREVSQAAKFYVDLSGPDELEAEEVEKIIPELKVYSPYKSVFLQVETPETVHNVLIKDYTDETKSLTTTDNEKTTGILSFVNYVYIKEGRKGPYFLYDPNTYNICWHDDMSWTYEINGQGIIDQDGEAISHKPIWHDFLDLTKSPEGRYMNQGLEDHVQMIHSCFMQFMILLQYPMICNVKEVKGRGNIFLDKTVKHTVSELRREPKFTHKTLTLDLYGSSQQKGGVIEEGKGKAFHSVRKHLRRLANGKLTWVKAHFRGSKDHGTVFKDYDIDPTKPIIENNRNIH